MQLAAVLDFGEKSSLGQSGKPEVLNAGALHLNILPISKPLPPEAKHWQLETHLAYGILKVRFSASKL